MAEWKFSPGRIVITRAALEVLPASELSCALARHLAGDWGEVDREDWHANEAALIRGQRILSLYLSAAGVRFYIITDCDRSLTTILLPEDY
jgi:hypothetical protein